jgi:predicted HAD superfamily Cof-like phosphohydrolase
VNHVRQFHEAFGIPVFDSPTIPSARRVELRGRLIKEEFLEVTQEIVNILGRLHANRYTTAAAVYADVAKLAKELSDLRYVCWGTDLEFGIPSDAVDREVHRSNMSKLWPDGALRHRSDGKVLKSPTYSEADILAAFDIHEGTTSP